MVDGARGLQIDPPVLWGEETQLWKFVKLHADMPCGERIFKNCIPSKKKFMPNPIQTLH